MQIRILLIAAFFPLLVSCRRELPEPHSILQKAIDAHGGQENIKKPRKGILKGTDEANPEITQEEFFDLPEQWKRHTTRIGTSKPRSSFLLMIDGELWEWEEGSEAKRTEKPSRHSPHFAVLTTLLELCDAKLSAVNGVNVERRTTFGFRADKDQNVGEFYFAKDTGLLAQMISK